MHVLKFKYFIFFFLGTFIVQSQEGLNSFLKPSDTLNTSRRNAVVIGTTSISALTLIGLNQLWYADFERSTFQTINDNSEWLQMDKVGHVYAAYQMGRLGADLFNWSGVSKKKQLLYGGTLGFTFLTCVEVLDGFSKEWGFSFGDIASNALGTSLFIGQELLWNEQRILLKFSFYSTTYPKFKPDKLGHNTLEQIIKDYNAQTYWLSFNLHSFFKRSKIPKWLNVALGYGGEAMLSGTENIQDLNLINESRYRQLFLSLDVNFEAIKTESRFLKTIFGICNMIKFPFPALEINNKGVDFQMIY